MDRFKADKRSAIMARVKSKGNQATELRLIALLRKHKIRGWRRNAKLFGKPDFVFPKARVAIFVDGCFWHSCPKHSQVPRTNVDFWIAKLGRNKARDSVVNSKLKVLGWSILRIWQHELGRRNEKKCVERIVALLQRNV